MSENRTDLSSNVVRCANCGSLDDVGNMRKGTDDRYFCNNGCEFAYREFM